MAILKHIGRGPKSEIAAALQAGSLVVGDLVVTTGDNGNELILIERDGSQVVIKSRTQSEVDILGTKVPAGSDIEAVIGVIASVIASTNGVIGEVEDGKTVVEMIADAQAAATYDDTQVKADIQANADAIQAHKDLVDGVVTTLVGSDSGKSVRTIANEELAAQLLTGDAEADFETLQELARWLEDHPEDAAAMNLSISNLQTLVGTLPEGATATDVVGYIAEAVAAEKSRAEGIEGGLDTRLQAVEALVGEGGSVDDKIEAAKTAAVTAANGYTDEKIAAEVTARDEAIATAKSSAKAYVDEKVAATTTWVDFGA